MRLLKIEANQGLFMGTNDEYIPVDKLTKEHLLRMVNLTLSDEVEFDEYVAEKIPNQAHQIIYKSVYSKLSELKERRAEFVDQSERLFLQDYEKYKQDAPQQGAEPTP
jgi:hypothetical protein